MLDSLLTVNVAERSPRAIVRRIHGALAHRLCGLPEIITLWSWPSLLRAASFWLEHFMIRPVSLRSVLGTYDNRETGSNSVGSSRLSRRRFSVVIAAHNVSAYIDRCLNSLVHQSVPLEILVVDDG